MKRIFFPVFLSMILFACAPVLNKTYLKEGERNISFNTLRQNPDAYKGKLYVFGGVIVQTKLTAEGSQIEALEVPVDRYGHFQDEGLSQGRFLAILPSTQGMLDPEVYKTGRRITLAAEFTDLRTGKVDDMQYTYPVFLIRQIYLWPVERNYYPAYYYNPWFYPYPYYYWDPWWSYPYFYYENRLYRGGPIYRRIPRAAHPPRFEAPQQRRAPVERAPARPPTPERVPPPAPAPAPPAPERSPERR